MLQLRPGMIAAVRRRFPELIDARLIKLDDGTWLDISQWRSREATERAAQAFGEIPEARAMGELIDEIVSFEHGVDIVLQPGRPVPLLPRGRRGRSPPSAARISGHPIHSRGSPWRIAHDYLPRAHRARQPLRRDPPPDPGQSCYLSGDGIEPSKRRGCSPYRF
jgi:hypothetical protein